MEDGGPQRRKKADQGLEQRGDGRDGRRRITAEQQRERSRRVETTRRTIISERRNEPENQGSHQQQRHNPSDRGGGQSWQGQAGQQEDKGPGGNGGGGAPGETLVVLYLNAQSVVGKINELSCTVSEMEPDLILITETWCNSDITTAYLNIAGYELQPDLRVDREDTKGGRGGGLLVYSKAGLQILKLDSGATFKQHCTFLVKDIIFYLIYRSPSSPASNLTNLADLVRGAEKNCVIIGDFNLPGIDWERGVATGHGKELLEAADNKLMSQLVEFSTQVKGNILDLVLTNMPEIVPIRSQRGGGAWKK